VLNPTAREFQPTPSSATHTNDEEQNGNNLHFGFQSGGGDYDQYTNDMYAVSAVEHYSQQQQDAQSVYLHQQHLAHQMAQMGLGSDLVMDAYGNSLPIMYGGGYHQAVLPSGAAYVDSLYHSSGADSTWYGHSDQQQQQSGTVYYSVPPHVQHGAAYMSSEQSSGTV
jgi:hypothetical protein